MTQQRRPYHIGIDARFYRAATGGIGRYTRELIAHLAVLDTYNQYSIFISPADLPEFTLTQENFRIVVVEAAHYSFAEQTQFLRILRKEKCDLVHFLNFNHPILYRRPFVTTLHDLTMYFFPIGRSQKSRLRRQAFILTLKRSLKAAKKVIAVSENSARDAEKIFGISHAKMEVIYHGGPDPSPTSFGSRAVIQDFLGSREPYFLFVSQWRPHKGIVMLIESFNKFKNNSGLPHQLVLAGKQDVSQTEVREAIARSPYIADILTPGFIPDDLLGLCYHYATALIMPSEYEGFGLPILEAFQYGAPAIVADNSSIPEVAGSATLYFPTKNISMLAERMEHVATSNMLCEDLREKGYKQLKKFSWAKMAQRTLDVYMSVLEKQN